MNWQLFLSTFGVIFLAEMGDKSQLMSLAFVPFAGWFAGASVDWSGFYGDQQRRRVILAPIDPEHHRV